MNTILAIDTTLGACSAAIIKDGELLGHMLEARARGHVERLLPMVAELCEETGTALPELSHIAVTVGPGTFAGVRIGLSAAKGMGLALDVPLIPVTTLQAIAYEYGFDHKDFSGKIAVAIDARRGEIYLQVFEINLGACEGYSDAAAVPIDTAKNNWHKYMESGKLTRASVRKGLIASCILHSCFTHNIPVEREEICKVCECNSKSLSLAT